MLQHQELKLGNIAAPGIKSGHYCITRNIGQEVGEFDDDASHVHI